MKKEYWEKMAADYEAEIFDVFKHDKKGLITRLIRKYGEDSKRAGDYGCGIGRFLPALAKHFSAVNAYDISAGCIARAEKECGGLTNVSFKTMDLAAPSGKLRKNHFALSVNTLIMPARKTRTRILDLMVDRLRRGGSLVLVVPALESVLYTHSQLLEWKRREGVAVRALFHTAIRKNFTARSVKNGIVRIDGVSTKHYLQEELTFLLEQRELRVRRARKIQYPWTTEFDAPPRWMGGSGPWDWLIVAEKP